MDHTHYFDGLIGCDFQPSHPRQRRATKQQRPPSPSQTPADDWITPYGGHRFVGKDGRTYSTIFAPSPRRQKEILNAIAAMPADGLGSSNAKQSAPLQQSNQPPLSLSILGVEPMDEFIREVADWVHDKIGQALKQGYQGVIEVEAKLGVLKYKEGDMRMKAPVRVETILGEEDEHRFESNMTALQHKHFNEQLNKLEALSRQPGHPTSPLRYQHSYLIDSFYQSSSGERDKIRVTRDEKTGEVKGVMQKIRLGNLDVTSPKRCVDWRVTVNIEVPVQQPVGTALFTRRKDRLSYSHEEFVIDLTQVTQSSGPSPAQVMHELEIEFARPEVLIQTARVRGDPSVPLHEQDAFDELIRAFVNNVRILVRNAIPPM